MTSQAQYLEYIQDGKYEKFFVDELKEATSEQVKLIGEAIFGDNLGPLSYSYPDFIKGFRDKYGVGEFSTADKAILNFINGRVAKSDFYIMEPDEEGNERKVWYKKPTFDEVMKEIKRIREQ